MGRREGERVTRTGEGGGKRHSRTRDSRDEGRGRKEGHRRSTERGYDDGYYYDDVPRERSRGEHHHGQAKRASAGSAPPTTSDGSSKGSSHLLSADSLARLNAEYEKSTSGEADAARKAHGAAPEHRGKTIRKHHQHDKRKRRVTSGAVLEEGGPKKHEAEYVSSEESRTKKRRRWLWIAIIVVVLLLVILIPVGVVVGRRNSKGSGGASSATNGGDPAPNKANLENISEKDIPAEAKGTILDPFTWYDTKDFNVTYTAARVGDLPIMGLNSAWNDHTRANDKVPWLDEKWEYGTRPIRGVNIGGWLNLEPFITPSLFRGYSRNLEIVDEYTLSKHLGPAKAAEVLEKHYATFVTERTFAEIAAAGLDHVRIPFGYWAVVTYPDDPYVPLISWRYLLRGIEWARKYGLRVNLDLHGAPGSQNGWNHSGRLGVMGWLNGTDGALNGQRTLEIHDRLSKFFAQPRYKNIVAIYGLLNEPKMIKLPVEQVHAWNRQAINRVRANGITAKIAIGDGFLGLPNWKGQLTEDAAKGEVVLDAHQYLIFNVDQLSYTHLKKLEFVCSGWRDMMTASVNMGTGFGPTICGEWSQADTDCAIYLNNVNVGARWTGNYNTGDPSTSVLTPVCPASSPNSPTTQNTNASPRRCSCDQANAPASQYSAAYKKYLLALANAQMDAFETGWGWFYWTWDTEETVQWSWKKGREGGTLPPDPATRERVCPNSAVGAGAVGAGAGAAGTAGAGGSAQAGLEKWVDPSLGEEY